MTTIFEVVLSCPSPLSSPYLSISKFILTQKCIGFYSLFKQLYSIKFKNKNVINYLTSITKYLDVSNILSLSIYILNVQIYQNFKQICLKKTKNRIENFFINHINISVAIQKLVI